ncbi:glycosyltransferase [Wenxinia saemankumensis]|uniref:Putative rhamnosyl transferase n=1 Tax=Wenxinia saemankumensis TaxID=1447782 RepID=A0A1M6HSZ1_9RHOB|nr:glycosyltransferase [Wenxinia saemankumensis]SHJ25257.1 Putative rhamnosyl transferase [Wenxinia saemankumensis]
MARDEIKVLGICRFSMIGRGDWKAYSGVPDDELGPVYKAKARELFAPARMEARLASFEHLTLASLRNQSDPDFTLLVVSSDRMPAPYRRRLKEICDPVPQVVLKFVPSMHVTEVVKAHVAETKLALADCVQFRLDDDDCVASGYIRQLKRHARALWGNRAFGISFSRNYYCVTDGPTEGIYDWPCPFFSAGAAIRHPAKTVFEFGHFAIPSRFVSVVDPHVPNIVTHRGDNDTPRHSAQVLRRRGMKPAKEARIRADIDAHFAFLGRRGLALCGFPTEAPPRRSAVAKAA